MKEIKQSETIVVRRSQIAENPWNPKAHTTEQVEQQKRNFRKVGYLGGIIWNKASGNLIDGHRRLRAYDAINRYDGTPETDYDIKVEMVEFDDKTEKEQMTYQAVGNSKADYNLIARFIHDIDPSEAGISDEDARQITMLADDIEDIGGMQDITADFLMESVEQPAPLTELRKEEKTSEEIVREHQEKPKMTKEEVKEQKAHCDNVAASRQDEQDLYMFVTFRDFEQKRVLCELLQREPKKSMQVTGDEILSLL